MAWTSSRGHDNTIWHKWWGPAAEDLTGRSLAAAPFGVAGEVAGIAAVLASPSVPAWLRQSRCTGDGPQAR